MSLVKRIWVGPFTAELPDGRVWQPGDTVEVEESQAKDNGHFKTPPKQSKADS